MLGGQFMPGVGSGTQESGSYTAFTVNSGTYEDASLRDFYDTFIGGTPQSGDTVQITTEGSVRLGQMKTGDWPAGVTLRWINYQNDVYGAGGQGGNGGTSSGDPGDNGGAGFSASVPVIVDNYGTIAGGGGGGGGPVDSGSFYGGGGGGRGRPGGAGGFGSTPDDDGNPGSEDFPGEGSPCSNLERGGDGGNLATAGDAATTGAAGGDAGPGVVGGINITWENTGTIIGVIIPTPPI